jgi:flagellar hook-basal body protein
VAGSPTYNFIAEFDEAKLDGSPTVMTIWYQQPPKTTDAYIAAKAAYEAAVTAYADIAAAQDTANAAKAAAQAAVDAETARAAAEAAWTADQGNTDLLAAKISAENAALNKYQAAIKAILTAGEKANAAETSVRKAASEAETAKLEAEEDVTDAEDKGAAAESKRPQAELDLNGKNVLLGTAKGELTAAQGELATAESDLVAAKAAYDPTEPDTVTALATAEAAAQTAKDAVVTAQTNVQNAQTAVQAAQATLDEVLKNIDDAKTELSEALTAQTAAEKLQALLDTTATTGLLVEVAAAKAAAEDANTALGSATNAEGLKEAAAEFAPVDVSSAQKVLDAAAEASRWEIVPLKATVSFNTDGTFDTVSSVTGFPATGTLNANNFRIAPTTSKTSLEIRVAQNLQNAPDISEALTNYNVLSSVSQGAYEQTKLTVYDCQGNAYTMEISFKKVTEDRWRWEAFFPDNPELFDSPPSGELLFGSCGKVVEPLDGVDIYVPFSLLGTQNETIHLDFSNKYFKGEDYVWDTDALEGLTQYAASTTVNAYYQDGYEMGVLNDYTVSPDGTITGIYTNDQTQPIYRVALAQFANPMGLDKVGDTMFRESINSGIAQIGAAEDNGAGRIASGSLEMSNVDLTEEFTRLIIAQRGFQANTRVVTTSDQILEEVVNLKR